MRILYIDIDSLRPDHLGCYGYHRDTSPNIDRIATEGMRFENIYVSDAPCLPSRTALFSGRTGFRTGVMNHGGIRATPYNEGFHRGDRDSFGDTGWMNQLRNAGFKTATISSFGERHAAWHWYAGFSEIINPGRGGLDYAHEVNEHALGWLDRHIEQDNWFLHVNFWDPHTPYDTPLEFGYPFADDPIADWLSETKRQAMWESYGTHSTQEPHHWGNRDWELSPRIPKTIDSMDAAKQWIDGYDTGLRYCDEHIGQLLDKLSDAGILDDTLIMVSADHGENLGELNVWGDHQTADAITCRVPLIVRYPEWINAGTVNTGLHYQFDWAATLLELVGGEVPVNWDGQSFADDLQRNQIAGRDTLVISQAAWSCQRGVRFDDYLYIHTYEAGLKNFPREMLFKLTDDPHEEHNLAESHPEIIEQATRRLHQWRDEQYLNSDVTVDPMLTVVKEGGGFYTRGRAAEYITHLRATGREHHADAIAKAYGVDA